MATPKRKVYKVGIIGAGAIAQECHFPGYKKDRRSKVVAFAEPTAERHDEVKERFGKVTGYTDYKEMLKNEDLDIVSICTPNVFHAENAIAALNAGCHVLCEKPIATTLKDADRMIAAAKKAQPPSISCRGALIAAGSGRRSASRRSKRHTRSSLPSKFTSC